MTEYPLSADPFFVLHVVPLASSACQVLLLSSSALVCFGDGDRLILQSTSHRWCHVTPLSLSDVLPELLNFSSGWEYTRCCYSPVAERAPWMGWIFSEQTSASLVSHVSLVAGAVSIWQSLSYGELVSTQDLTPCYALFNRLILQSSAPMITVTMVYIGSLVSVYASTVLIQLSWSTQSALTPFTQALSAFLTIIHPLRWMRRASRG